MYRRYFYSFGDTLGRTKCCLIMVCTRVVSTDSKGQNAVPMVCTGVALRMVNDKMQALWYVRASCVRIIKDKMQAPCTGSVVYTDENAMFQCHV